MILKCMPETCVRVQLLTMKTSILHDMPTIFSGRKVNLFALFFMHSFVVKPSLAVNTDSKECLRSKQGYEYRGTLAVTESNRTCKNWTDSRFKGKLGDQRNYCRNPDKEPKPWCYTTDPTKTWEFCNVSMCRMYILH